MDVSIDPGQEIDLAPEPIGGDDCRPSPSAKRSDAHSESGTSFGAGWDHASAGRECPELQLASLARATGTLRRVQAAIAARLVETKAHDRLCYARLGDYARERAGVSGRQLQELARVHRALEELPALERALCTDALPWSKVRLVARVATAEDEAAWIARARAISTRRLEDEVREHARALAQETPDDDEPLARLAVRCTPAVREKWSLVREFAQRVAGQRLRDADVLEAAVAEASSALPIDPAFVPRVDEPPPPRLAALPEAAEPGDDGVERTPASEPPLEVAALAAGLDEVDAFEVDRRLRTAIRMEQTLDAAIAPLLRIVTCSEYEWRGSGYQPLARYAPEQLGMSVGKARALLRLERAGDVCPELRSAYRSGRLSWVKAQCLLPLLLRDVEGEWRPAWVAWAQRVTVRRLERDVERALLLRGPAWRRARFHPEHAQDPIPESERQLCAYDVDPDATGELVFRVPHDVASLFVALRQTIRKLTWLETGRQLHDGEAFDAVLSLALVAWIRRDPRARRPDPVIERDGYQCAIPGCSSRRSLHDHHVIFRSRGGDDEEVNRLTLCAFHHQRCVHAELLRVAGRAPDALVFEMGLRPGAPPLLRYRSGDIEIRSRADSARRGRRRAA
ncbi:MAG: hypothetical protein QNK04_09400 [Myxococcota bacterium]|nr:hypothetical protein [Myxococcota bacterium]